MSMVNIAELELKMDVSEDMRAASMTARRSPLSPSGNVSFTSMMKAMLVQPDLKKINNMWYTEQHYKWWSIVRKK